jgi:hypothetical protein
VPYALGRKLDEDGPDAPQACGDETVEYVFLHRAPPGSPIIAPRKLLRKKRALRNTRFLPGIKRAIIVASQQFTKLSREA